MTISEVKKIMTDAFINDPVVVEKYELEVGKSFEEQFSVVSLESIFFYIVATAVWLSFQLFDRHKADVLAELFAGKAHTNQWYAAKAKLFQYGYNLLPETGYYDNSGLTEEQIAASRIIRFSAAIQSKDKSILYIKVATEVSGQKQPLTITQLTAFQAYMDEISDAGVFIEIINAPADEMRLAIDVYYNPLVLDGTGKRLDGTGNTPVQEVTRSYLSNLPFNGLYTNQSLIDSLQKAEGVEQAELKSVSSRYGNYTEFRNINARSIPYSGYYSISASNLTLNFVSNAEYL